MNLMDSFPEKIDIDDLYDRKNEVYALKQRVFQKILSRVHAKIKVTSRQRNSAEFCFFIVPEFLVGTPLYDSASCIAYIIEKLLSNGFFVKYTHPNLLFISWQHYIDKQRRAVFKKMHGFAIDGFGNKVKDRGSKDVGVRPVGTAAANNLMLKSTAAVTVKKADTKTFKDIATYKPTGSLIYNTQLLKSIEKQTQK